MHPLAIAAVLLAALTHATWNLAAKRASGSRHFVWLYSAASVVLYAPAVLAILFWQRPQFGARQMQWPGEQGIEYHLAHGEWIDLLRASGFEIERLIELKAPPDAKAHEFYDYVTPDWAWQWPAEEMWVARLRTAANP